MLRTFAALLSGGLFGVGLAVSGMINPAKVIGFLDLAGNWDPTLAFVMGGAVLITMPAFRFILRWQRPLLGRTFDLPEKKEIDGRLIGGAVVFGVGWGLSGFCPGPAVAALVSGIAPVVAFVAAMLVGMAVYALLFERKPHHRKVVAGRSRSEA
jgi:uncharacterized membrane protein YedE/YeeE